MNIKFSNPEFLQGTTPDGAAKLWLVRFETNFGEHTFKMQAHTPEMKLDGEGMPVSEWENSSPFENWFLLNNEWNDNITDIFDAFISDLNEHQHEDNYEALLSKAIDTSGLAEWLECELKKTCLYPVPRSEQLVTAAPQGSC